MKAKKLTPTGAMSATNVVTKVLLNDTNNGYKIGNLVLSPLLLDIILGMMAAGADGETLKQLLGFLGHESIDMFLAQSTSSKLFKRILPIPKAGLGFSLANGVWVDRSVAPVQSSYQEVLETAYKTEARCVDFGIKGKLDNAVGEINSWVHKETNALIPSIVERRDFDKSCVMAITNALYFKGSYPFDSDMTRDQYFHPIRDYAVLVPFMTTRFKKFDYASKKDYQLIKIPYEREGKLNNKFSMYIFLPNEYNGLKNLLQLFHSDDALFHGEFNLQRVSLDTLWIPKFKISSKFEPKDVLKQMGLTLPFEKTNKELSGIIVPRRDNMLYVSKILQKSCFEVDERGAKPAAYVRKTDCPKMNYYYLPLPSWPSPSFVADHPFMFMIREDSSKAVVFVGVVLNPASS